MVKSVGSLSEFEAELQSAGEKLIVVDFSATWCGPCKMIKPFFHSLCEKYGDVVFIEIDVDDAQDVAAHCDVKCMPTFQFYKNGKKVFLRKPNTKLWQEEQSDKEVWEAVGAVLSLAEQRLNYTVDPSFQWRFHAVPLRGEPGRRARPGTMNRPQDSEAFWQQKCNRVSFSTT
ncbi:thioredoxin isoform X2 [Strigops habroptila]|uniref:thioredoxin isoform X2 n=1 Tax=Strigops habroptila TaxID=2489341 RepID=UPI0011CFC4A4|nr:thioredoxin isoform X2 [Strigops habroptila]